MGRWLSQLFPLLEILLSLLNACLIYRLHNLGEKTITAEKSGEN